MWHDHGFGICQSARPCCVWLFSGRGAQADTNDGAEIQCKRRTQCFQGYWASWTVYRFWFLVVGKDFVGYRSGGSHCLIITLAGARWNLFGIVSTFCIDNNEEDHWAMILWVPLSQLKRESPMVQCEATLTQVLFPRCCWLVVSTPSEIGLGSFIGQADTEKISKSGH